MHDKEPVNEHSESHYPGWIKFCQAEWGNLLKAKWAVLVLLASTVYGTSWLVEHSSSDVIKSKDAVIQAKDAIIERQKRELDLGGNPSLTPLKSRALILSRQIAEAAYNWPTNGDPMRFQVTAEIGSRFESRLGRMRNELDEHGQRMAEFDALVNQIASSAGDMTSSNVLRMSQDLQKMAENLKE
jgi:hypothetical protein